SLALEHPRTNYSTGQSAGCHACQSHVSCGEPGIRLAGKGRWRAALADRLSSSRGPLDNGYGSARANGSGRATLAAHGSGSGTASGSGSATVTAKGNGRASAHRDRGATEATRGEPLLQRLELKPLTSCLQRLR